MFRRTSCLLLAGLAFLWLSSTSADSVAAIRTITVAADGSAEFTSIGAALESIPPDGHRYTIAIREGSYYEKVRIDRDRVTLQGESRDGVRIRYNLPRSEYDKRYDAAGPAVVNLFAHDIILENLTVENIQQQETHAFAVYGQPYRCIISDCDILGVGGDTLSLWNTSFGMYYHRNCRFQGGVDFVCPRGWCYIRDSQFEAVSTSAAIWHDGHMDLDMKFVLENCRFDGAENFWLGRNHYPCQFYLLDCWFSENMANKPIGTVSEPAPGVDPAVYERKYYYNCDREGEDYEWFADNLDEAPSSPRPETITAAWTFDHRWDPESTEPPEITAIETAGDQIYVYFSENVATENSVRILRADDSITEYAEGNGTSCLIFEGGSPDSPPRRLEVGEKQLYGTVATLEMRYVESQDLPDARPRQEITVVLIGDSTVATYQSHHAYQGWGAVLDQFFDDRVHVVNMARGGRSSKSFREEGLWDRARQVDADYVLIQFGHNDNPGKGPERETDPAPGGTYRENLRRYVEETRAMGAQPILVSPPTRRFFVDGQIDPSEKNVPYAEAVVAVAEEVDCPVVDLNLLSRDLFNRLGEASSDWIQVEEDRTHFTPAGARRIAATVLRELQQLVPELEPFILDDRLYSVP